MKQETIGWQWHQLDHMQIICTSLQTDNHASMVICLSTDRMVFLTPNKQCQSTEGSELVNSDSAFNSCLILSHCLTGV